MGNFNGGHVQRPIGKAPHWNRHLETLVHGEPIVCTSISGARLPNNQYALEARADGPVHFGDADPFDLLRSLEVFGDISQAGEPPMCTDPLISEFSIHIGSSSSYRMRKGMIAMSASLRGLPKPAIDGGNRQRVPR